MKRAEKIVTGHWDLRSGTHRRKPYTGPGHKRHAKRLLRRARRRAERLDPESAGTRICDFTRGWTT